MMTIKKLKIINALFKMTIGAVLQKHKHFLKKNFHNGTYSKGKVNANRELNLFLDKLLKKEAGLQISNH